MKADIKDLATAYFVLLGMKQDSKTAVTAAVLINLMSRIKKLKIELGELCIVEMLSGITDKTAASLCTNLFGRPCRYSASRCQFKINYICKFSLEAVKQTMDAMEKQQILKKLNHVEPILWTVI